ncbi:fungal-specific transcription factor domain-containing protein [Dipodascopsis tothii]|uniref:fungal-specific transcription factor domain-containing protein n=1 Tax=Dipodascopsis tothii TaxID=44089 RepID=UPI0034CD8561
MLIAIVTIGMAYSNIAGASDLAITIHRKFRNIVFLMIEDQPHVQLWVHQTLLLTNYFDKMLGSTVQYDMSQFFHGTNIALMHFSGYLKGTSEPAFMDERSGRHLRTEQQWKEWVVYETTKRTAFFAFICDTQHATLFRHSPILSAFEVRLELPCTDACWEASSADQFFQAWEAQTQLYGTRPAYEPRAADDDRRPSVSTSATTSAGSTGPPGGAIMMLGYPDPNPDKARPPFLHSLKRLIRPTSIHAKDPDFSQHSQFSCLILLHGLLSICWDMQWRGLLDMGIVSKHRMTEFKSRLAASFDNWKSYFDSQLRKSNLPSITSVVTHNAPADGAFMPAGHFMNNFKGNSPMLCSNWAMYQLGLIVLHVDTMNLRVNAGSPNVLGRKIRDVDREMCNRQVQAWARSEDGRLATLYSVQFMIRMAENERLLDAAVHIPWCVYLTTLTIWSYEICQGTNLVPPPGTTKRPADGTTNDSAFHDYRQLVTDRMRYKTDAGVNVPNAKTDAVTYLRLLNERLKSPALEAQSDDGQRNMRKQMVVGLVAYSVSLLVPIKWGFVVRGCEVLANILKEYD